MAVWLHEVGPQGKGVVPHQEEWHILVVIGQWTRCWPASDVVVFQAISELTVVVDVSI